MRTKIDQMIEYLRKGENYYLESNTSMAERTDKQRIRFEKLARKYKNKGAKIYTWLVKNIGIDDEYLEEIITNEGI